MVRQAHHERTLLLTLTWQSSGLGDRATQATVVPAKAGIQEIHRKRTSRLPKVLDSGFRRNDGII